MIGAPSIIEAVNDPAIFRPQFRDSASWLPWWVAVKAIFGLPLNDDEMPLFMECTGRTEAPTERAKEAWLVVGRRGGKSRVLALIAAYLAVFIDWAPFLSPGERGVIVIVAADRKQCRTIMTYLESFLRDSPLLAKENLIVRDTAEELELTSGLTIEVVTSSYRAVRGRTIIAALCDEVAFWADDSGANPASEVIRALRPAMATIPGALLLAASSPYAKRGPLWDAFRRNFGKAGPLFVWKADTRTMNPSVPQSVVDDAYEADPESAASEYGAEFRSGIAAYIEREVVEALVVSERFELLPGHDGEARQYVAFADPSGGSGDSMTIAIGHADSEGRAILDAVREWRPPFSPDAVVQECAELLRRYGISAIEGDFYAGEWPRERFQVHGITYERTKRFKSDIYRELLPVLNSGRCELLDIPRLQSQLCGLERKTARGGRDSIDHGPGGRDDVANAAAGVIVKLAGAEDIATIWNKFGENARLILGANRPIMSSC